jgi:hypothetical protein
MPLSDLWVVLRVAPAADALKVERLREDAALALRLTDKILAEMKAADS